MSAPAAGDADLKDLAVAIATEAGALLLDASGRDRTDVSTKSSATDMVTEVDRAAEALIVDRLRAARPRDGVLAEEGSGYEGTSGVRWVVDPLDGTTNFLYGYLAYSVSIAAERDGVVVAGAVYDPLRNETYAAVRGGGATCNGRPLHGSGATALATALIGTGFWYAADMRTVQAGVLARLIDRVRDIRRGGCASLDLCWVAAGRLDGFYEAGLQPWDLAAGSLIAAEAGAWVGELDTVPVTPGPTAVAVAPQLAEDFVELLRAAHRAQADPVKS